MKINGLQKLTLLDYPGRCACTVFLAGCDLKCPYCHNSELISSNAPVALESAELMRFLSKRRGILDGVAVTGGEPLLRPDIEDFIKEIRSMGLAVKLDTNGTHPEKLEKLLAQHLVDYVAMDIKNSSERYAVTCGKNTVDIENIKESIGLIMKSGTEYEFRTTVVAQLHDESSFEAIGHMVKGAEKYYLQAFADRDTVLYEGFSAPSKTQLESYLEIVRPHVKYAAIRGV